jgi:hypothetical protein
VSPGSGKSVQREACEGSREENAKETHAWCNPHASRFLRPKFASDTLAD